MAAAAPTCRRRMYAPAASQSVTARGPMQGELMNPAGTNDGFHVNRHVITDLSLAILQDSRWCAPLSTRLPHKGLP